MTTVVVSQPMFLPWIGMFEQIALADVYVHYDDVQFTRGRAFTNRVQVSTRSGSVWITAPIDRALSGKLISETVMASNRDWRSRHLETLHQLYCKLANFRAMFDLTREIYAFQSQNLSAFNMNAIELISDRMELGSRFVVSGEMGIAGQSTGRVVGICRALGASRYVTGHGAVSYLDHEAFEAEGISVDYMNYAPRPWQQNRPEFTPYVSILDLLAAVRFDEAKDHFASSTQSWRTFKAAREAHHGDVQTSSDN